jgi:segregation and condensation protein B
MTMNEEELFQNLRALEAVLFTAQDLVTENDLKAFFPNKDTDISLLLEHLQQHYQTRGVNLVKRGNGWGLRTAPDLAERLEVRKVEVRPMSRATVETLSIIAYHQPVTRTEIEQVRGVSIGKNAFEFLMAENLIKPGKRREVVGRPLTWVTTQHFLDTFGLESLKELPNLQELKDTGLLSMTPPQLVGMEQQSLPLAIEDRDMEEDEDTDFDDNEFASEQEQEEGEAA